MRSPEELQQLKERFYADTADKMDLPFTFQFDFTGILSLISQLQLALRHPANTGPTSEYARQVISQFREQIGLTDSIKEVIDLGFDERYDGML